jgi:hypothetical protein
MGFSSLKKTKFHAPKAWLPGKVLLFYIVPMDPVLKGGAYGALAGQNDLRIRE